MTAGQRPATAPADPLASFEAAERAAKAAAASGSSDIRSSSWLTESPL